MNAYQQAISQYKNIELESKVLNASPHELISLLFQGAKSHINSALTCLVHKQTASRCHHIGKAISIVSGLRSSLDMDDGKEIADNLDKLYEYIQHILLMANLKCSDKLLQEAYNLLSEIAMAWEAIKEHDGSQSKA